MTDLNELMKQARKMQEQFQKAQEEAAKRSVVGEAGAGMVRVELGGQYDARRVQLSDDVLKEDKEIVEDLIAAAINDAVKKLADTNRDMMGQMASGLQLPEGFKFPF